MAAVLALGASASWAQDPRFEIGDVDATARPYVFGGAGITQYGSVDFLSAAGERRSTGGESQFSTTWGAGVKIYPSKRVGHAQYSNQFEFTGGLSLRF